MSEIPDGWINIPLDELGDWGSGGTPKRTNQRYYQDGEIPWLIIGDLNDGIVYSARTYITEEGLQNSSTKLLPINTILIAMYGSIGKLGITGFECATNQAIAFCKPNADIVILKYLFYCLMESKNALIAQGQGGAQQNISQGVLKAHTILLAPLNEQQRIADKLDRLLAKVDNCRERIDRIPLILKSFRRSVLNLAISGQLTEDWTNNEKWSYVTLGKLLSDIRYGTSKKSFYDGDTPVLRIPNIQNGHINIADLKYGQFDSKEIETLALKIDDILIIRSNGSVDLVGKAAIIAKENEGYLFAGYLIRLRLKKELILSMYLYLFLSSPSTRKYIELTARSTSGVNNINSEEIRAIEVPLPSLGEQQEIVRRVEKLFDFADRLEARYQTARAQIDKLTPALLAKAFKGELVHQDPNDEPAADLLAKIQQARSNPENHPPKQPKTPRKPPSPKIIMLNRNDIETSHLADILKNNGTLTAESLWNISKLSIDDFYDQLKDEELQGLLKETIAETSTSLRLLEAI